jgi:signal transduction histidine kinase
MKKIFLLSVLLVFQCVVATAQVIPWDGQSDYIDIGNQVQFLEDAQGSLSFEDVSSDSFNSEFQSSEKVILNFGFTESVYWLKFSFNNASDEPLILELAHAFLPIADLFYRDASGQVQQIEAGYNVPLNQKEVKHHFQVYPLPKGRHDFYLRLISNSHPLKLQIHKESAYDIKTYRQRLVYGFYLGFMVFVILSNLFFYVTLRSHLYLFYAGIVLVYISYASAVMDGFILYFFPRVDLMFWYITIPTLGVPLQLLYAKVFLEVKHYHPRLARYTNGLIIYFFAYMVIKFFLPLTTVLAVNTVHALVSFFAMGYLGIATARKGNRLGNYFALAYFIYFLLVLTEATYIQIGKPGYFFELSHVALATLIEAFLLSFLLSKKFEFEKKDAEQVKEEAQRQLLQKTLENEKMVKEQNVVLEREVSKRTEELNSTIRNLKQTQDKLIQSEKMASLGELTAGIAHEIQNPLNFVNNFSEVSVELMDELQEELQKGDLNEVKTLSYDVRQNLEKITQHGQRASAIVRGMLSHSRSKSGEKELISLNTLADEFLRLSYHGLRAKDKGFNADFKEDFDESLPKIKGAPQDLGRVLLNIINNAFQACSGYAQNPLVTVRTYQEGNQVVLTIKDNGPGIPAEIKDKIFQPFFTTKPTGQGTGLGLSISYDIVKAHGGTLEVESMPGETVFILALPI